MNDFTPIEKNILQAYHLPEANPAFLDRLESKLRSHRIATQPKAKAMLHVASGWVYAMATLLLIAVLLLVAGPAKVLAQVRAIFGFVPDVGLVDTSAPFRQLAEPVSDKRDGITLTVQSAFLSADQTIITYSMSDLSAEIARAKFGDPECIAPAYLILPDGTNIVANENSGGLTPDGSFVHRIQFSNPLPANDKQATLVFPCLAGTAQGKGPQNWQIALAFKPMLKDMVVYPATLMPPQTKLENSPLATLEPTMEMKAETKSPSMPARIVDGNRQEEMIILSVVDKPESYWITWAYPDQRDTNIQINGRRYVSPFNPVLFDANGKELPAPNHDTQLQLWQYEDSLRNQLPDQDQMKYGGTIHTFVVPKSGVAFPIYARQDVYERSFPEKEAYVEIEFDGTKVQTSEKPVEINQVIQLGSVKFKLEAIEKDQFGGYSFLFDGSEGQVVQCMVNLSDYPTNIGGSDSFNPGNPFHFRQTIITQQVPTGKLKVRVSQPAVLGDLISFIGSWSPEK